MKKHHLVSLVICLGMTASASAGDLWVMCSPGLEIFLDGESVGVSDEAENGKRVPGVESGEHTIQVRKDGSSSAVYPFTLGPAAAQIVVPELVPEDSSDQSGSVEGIETGRLQGAIQFTSNPRTCTIESASREIEKQQPIMIFVGVPLGEFKFIFENSGTVLQAQVPVQSPETVQVRVDFSSGQVVIVGGTIEETESESAADENAPEAEPECIEYWVQVSRSSSLEELEPVQDILEDMGFPSKHQKVTTIEDDGVLPLYKLFVGPIERREKAKWVQGLISKAGFRSAFVVAEKCVPRERQKRKFKPVH